MVLHPDRIGVLAHRPSELGQCCEAVLPKATYSLDAQDLFERCLAGELDLIVADLRVDDADTLIAKVQTSPYCQSVVTVGLASDTLVCPGVFVYPHRLIIPPVNEGSLAAQIEGIVVNDFKLLRWYQPGSVGSVEKSMSILAENLMLSDLSPMEQASLASAVRVGLINACEVSKSRHGGVTVSVSRVFARDDHPSVVSVHIEDKGEGFSLKPFDLSHQQFNGERRDVTKRHHYGVLHMTCCVDDIHYHEDLHVMVLSQYALNRGKETYHVTAS